LQGVGVEILTLESDGVIKNQVGNQNRIDFSFDSATWWQNRS